MFITNHLVETDMERREILAQFPSLRELDPASVELLAVALDSSEASSSNVDKMVGCGVTTSLSRHGSRLLGFEFPSPYTYISVGHALFGYIAWELRERRKSYIIIGPDLANPAAEALLRDIGCGGGEKIAVKIDWLPPRPKSRHLP
jgi:hypothetical protein